MSKNLTYIATLSVPPDYLQTLPDYQIIAKVVQSDLARRYPAYTQSLAPIQPAYGLQLSLSDPERSFYYVLAIESGRVTITAPVPAGDPAKPPEGLHTPFTVQLGREIKRLLGQIGAAALAVHIRDALANALGDFQEGAVQVTRAKFAGEAIELRGVVAPGKWSISLLVYTGGYLHVLCDAPDAEQAAQSCDAIVARMRARGIPAMLTKAPHPLAAERLMIDMDATPDLETVWRMVAKS